MKRPLFLPLSLLAALAGAAFAIDTLRPPGQRPLEASSHALMGARVVIKPGQELEKANIIVRDGRIVAVGAEVEAPADARIHNLAGTTIYAGFIDTHLSLAASTTRPSPAEESSPVTDDLTAGAGSGFLGVASATGEPGTRSLVTPRRRMAAEYLPEKKALDSLRAEGFTAANVVPDGDSIVRGISTFVTLGSPDRDLAIIRPDTFQHIAIAAPKQPGAEPMRPRPYPGSLMGIVATIRQTMIDAKFQISDHAHAAAHPNSRPRPAFDPDLEALAPVVQKSMPAVFEPGAALLVDRSLRIASEFDILPIILASGQEWRRPDLVRAARAPFIVPLDFPEVSKLPDDADWDAVPLDQLRAWDHAPGNPALLRREGREIALTTHGLTKRSSFRPNVRLAIARGLSETDAIAALTTVPSALCGVTSELGTIEAGKLAHLAIFENGRAFDEKARLREVWIDGRQYPSAPAEDAGRKPADAKAKPKSPRETLTASPAQVDRGPLLSPAVVFIQNATLWTCGPLGRLERANLLVEKGKIAAIGPDLKAPEGAHIISLPNIHVTPGLIDCHSHSLILGGVNENTLPSTAMVRVGDVVNSESDTLHQQLAGGLTVANLLHGSANPIGGQNCVVKLRDGASPEALKLAGAPEGIKFALGENVKQSNWGEAFKSRFPQSRMGVPAFHTNRFTAARHYLEAIAKAKNGGPPARRDLELEAIGEILAGDRLVHCHSYRQDEIVAFLRVMESFNVRVATLQHILEGYKVADEIARHGAGASAFSDWWAFKYEVIDAIPHAGSLMRERGVLVSFNSDSSDLARRLNLEAAKAVKYGGTTEEEALKFVTINPARQLGIDRLVGSLEVGKDADFAIWSGHPLSTSSLCLQTWIDGKQYFERQAAHRRAEGRRAEHARLLEKAKSAAADAKPGGRDEKEAAKFFYRALELRETHLCVDCCLDREAVWRN